MSRLTALSSSFAKLRSRLERTENESKAAIQADSLHFRIVRLFYFDFPARLKFYNILLDATGAGMSVLERLRHVYKRTIRRGSRQQAIYQVLVERMNAGESLDRALAGLAPLQERMLIAAGEANNNIHSALEHLVWLMRRTEETRNNIIKAAINTLFQIVILVGTVLGIGMFIAPSVRRALPPESWAPITERFFAFSDFLLAGGWAIVPVLAVILVLFWRRTPLFYFYRLAVSASLLIALHSLVTSGVSLNEALKQIAKASGDFARQHILKMIANLSAGLPEGEAMDTGLLPRSIVEDLMDFSSAKGFANALESLGRMAHERFMRTMNGTVETVKYTVMLGIVSYIMWFMFAVGAAAVGSFSLIRF